MHFSSRAVAHGSAIMTRMRNALDELIIESMSTITALHQQLMAGVTFCEEGMSIYYLEGERTKRE